MIGLDTNVLVRFLLRDDEQQAEMAKALIDRQEIIVISLLTVQETEWVLRTYGKLSKPQVIATFRLLLDAYNLMIESEFILEEVLLMYEASNADFSDCLMTVQYLQLGCEHMVTFDQKAARLEGVVLVG